MRIMVIGEDGAFADAVAAGLPADAGISVVTVAEAADMQLAIASRCDLLVVGHGTAGVLAALLADIACLSPAIPVLVMPHPGHAPRPGAIDIGKLPLDLAARSQPATRRPDTLRVSDLVVDLANETVSRQARRIRLAPLAFRLLVYLMRHEGKVVSKKTLLKEVWGMEFDPGTTMVATQVARLRDRIDRGFDRRLIHAVKGKGYCLRELSQGLV